MAPHSLVDIEVEGVRDTEGIVIPDPLLLDDIYARRLKGGKLVAGVAALAHSDQFKTSVGNMSSSYCTSPSPPYS